MFMLIKQDQWQTSNMQSQRTQHKNLLLVSPIKSFGTCVVPVFFKYTKQELKMNKINTTCFKSKVYKIIYNFFSNPNVCCDSRSTDQKPNKFIIKGKLKQKLASGSVTLGQARFPFGDVVNALNGESPRLIYQQHGVSVLLDFQHSPLHPHQRHWQRASPAQSDHTAGLAVNGAPVPCGPQLPRQHFNRRGTSFFHVCLL